MEQRTLSQPRIGIARPQIADGLVLWVRNNRKQLAAGTYDGDGGQSPDSLGVIVIPIRNTGLEWRWLRFFQLSRAASSTACELVDISTAKPSG